MSVNAGAQMLNLNDVYYFAQVVEREGFAAAGRALGIPKSTLSKRVAALEESVGAQLILRSSRSFKVSPVGKEFYRHAAAMLVEAEAARDAVINRTAEPSGVVRLSTSMTTAQVAVSKVLAKLAQRYPKIQIELHATNRYVDLINEGFDLAVRAHYDRLPDSGLVQRQLGHSPVYLVASPKYLQARGTPRHPREIVNHDGLVTAASEAPTVWKLHNARGETYEARPQARHWLDEPLTLLHAASDGLGIACLPNALCLPGLQAGTLVRVLPHWSARGAAMTLLTSHRRLRLPAVEAVMQFLIEQIGPAMGLESQPSCAHLRRRASSASLG